MCSLLLFVFLQILDVATTLAGLHLGAVEENWFLRHLMAAGSPVIALAIGKLIALGILAAAAERPRLLGVLNACSAVLVTWNCGILWHLAIKSA